MALIIFPKLNLTGKTADVCNMSELIVHINKTQIFAENTTNCTINVFVEKSKVIQGFDMEWTWTQAGAVISSGKQKVTARILSEAYSTGGFVLTGTFMSQSYLTSGEIAAIVVGSVSFIFLVFVLTCCFCTNCRRMYPVEQKIAYQM